MKAAQQHKTLVYERTGDGGEYLALITSPENAKDGGAHGAPFEVANSMREVQPEINLLVSPVDERLYAYDGGPGWTLPAGADD